MDEINENHNNDGALVPHQDDNDGAHNPDQIRKRQD